MRLAHSTRRTRQAAPQAATPTASASIAVALSTSTSKLVAGIRDDFGAFVDGFVSLTTDRSTLAPKFMRAFEAWAKETKGSFVDFVRVLDAKVPADRDGYRAHPTYQAADYLRRKQADAGRERDTTPEDERPVSLNTALVYLLATVMPIVDPTESIWHAFTKEMRWSPEQAQRLKERAAKVGAVKLPPRVRHNLDALAVAKAA